MYLDVYNLHWSVLAWATVVEHPRIHAQIIVNLSIHCQYIVKLFSIEYIDHATKHDFESVVHSLTRFERPLFEFLA